MTYRKLTEGELAKYGLKINQHKPVIDWVQKNYPKTAVSALVMFSSEYDDNYYSNEIQTVLVYDKDGNELLPLKEKSVTARKSLPDMYYLTSNDGEGTREPLDDLVVLLTTPELYVKDSE